MNHNGGKKVFENAVAVAVTGSMGAGKSAVCRFLSQRLHWPLLSADLVCRALMTPESEGWHAFVELCGTGAVGADGEIDRPRLRRRIFEDAALRQGLEAILHPLARREILQQASRSKRAGESVLVEVPLLFEAGWQDDFDKVVMVYAAEGVSLARICKRDGVSLEEAGKGLAAQMLVMEKVLAADYVVDNSGSWSDTLLQMIKLGDILEDLAGFAGKKT